MKKIILALTLIVLTLLAVACKNEDIDSGSTGSQSQPIVVGGVQIVCNDDLGDKLYNVFMNGLSNELGRVVMVVPDERSQADIEVVIGKTNREISEKANLFLSRIDKESDTDVGYLLYSDGKSVAIAYEQDKYGLNASAIFGIDYFINNLLHGFGKTELTEGVITMGVIDPIEQQRVYDKEKQDEDWARLEAEAGTEVALALKDYYAMYSNRLISWMADLYDPKCGGFYFCNSGRDTEGYLPDIEATFHILSLIENSGMMRHIGTSYTELPDWFLEKMGRWVKGMQDPNGYFYHPQWGKELTDTKVARRGRDLNYGSAILSAAGLKPTYDTPSGIKGDYTLNDGRVVDSGGNVVATNALTSSLLTSVSTLVSKVVPTSEPYSEYLKDATSFKNYLYSLDLRNDSYQVGNRLSNQVNEIKQRDKELGGVLVPIMEQWLKENQNPENGMWEWRSEDDPTYSDYDGINGILKLLTLFNNLEMEYPNPIPATESIIKCIYTNDIPPSVCQPYNAWYAMEDLFKNLMAHTDDINATAELIAGIRERLRSDAVNLINHTAKKVARFIKDDSSSSYTATYSSDTSQGMRVAVPYTNEGDTNATVINTFGTLNHMLNVFGWRKPYMFGTADYYDFMNMIENQSDVIKHEEPDPIPLDFDNDTPGASHTAFDTEKCYSSGERMVIEDPTGAKKGNVYKYESIAGMHDSLFIPCESLNLNASCNIFESDIYISTDMEGYFTKIKLDEAYILGLVIEDGVIRFIDSSSQTTDRFEQDLGFSARLNEWFNLRIEYYAGETETVRIKIYLNGECVAVSGNFYDSKGYGVPYSFYSKVIVEVFTGSEMTYLFDNLLVHKTNAVYKEELDPDNQPFVNVDQPDKEGVLYDFEELDLGEGYPSDWSVSGDGEISVVENSGDKELLVTCGESTMLTVPLTKRNKDANANIFDAYINVNSIDKNGGLEIMLRDGGVMRTAIMGFRMMPITVDGESCVGLYETSAGILGSLISDTEVAIGEEFRLTIEYYVEKMAALIYIDGKLVAMSSATEAYAKRGAVSVVEIKKLGEGDIVFTLDDVTAEINTRSFDVATKPEKDSITHGFEDGIPEGAESQYVEIINAEGANKIAAFSDKGTLKIPVNKRSVANDTVILNLTLNIPANASQGDRFNISIISEDGSVILRYAVTINGGVAEIYEITAMMNYHTPIASFAIGKDTVISIERYKKKDVAHLYVGDSCVAVTSLLYGENSAALSADYVLFSADITSERITIDNVIIESYNKFFVYKTTGGANTEDNSEVITFEGSTTGNIPRFFSSDLRTASAALRIKEMIQSGKASKVLAFETSAGANDKLYFDIYSSTAQGNATVFETDLYFDISSDTTTYEFYFSNGSGTHAYLMLLSFADGVLNLNDITGASSALVPGRIFGTTKKIDSVVQGEWFNLRMEYYDGDHDSVRIKTYINDKLVYVSCGYYGRSTSIYGTQPAKAPNRVIISSYGGVVGSIYLDNMSLLRENKLVGASELTYIPKEAEPDLENSEDGAEILTFESSVTGNLPSAISKELNSSGGALTVRDVLRSSVRTKVMAFTTTSDAGDKLFIEKTKTQSGYNAIEFKTQISVVDRNSDVSTLYLYLRNGSTILARIVITVFEDGTVGFSDYYNSKYSFTDAQGRSGLTADEWRELKLTLYSNNGECRLAISYGDFTIVSKNPSWSSLTPDKVTSLRLDTSSASDFTILFDDLSFVDVNITIPEEHVHTYSEEWTYDEVNHWHEATCSYSEECASLKADLAEHSYGDDDLCLCGAKKPEETVSTTLGYFDALGGFDYEDAETHWNWSAKNTIKIIRNSGWTSGDKIVDGVSDSTLNYLNFYNLGDDRIAELNKGTTNSNPSEIYFVKQGGSGNTLVFESYIRLGASASLASAEDKTLLTLGFINETSNVATGYGEVSIVGVSSDGVITSYTMFDKTLTADVWYSFAIELNTETGVATYYVDAKAVGTTQVTEVPENLGYLRATLSGSAKETNVKFNDTYFGSVGKHLTESDEYYTFNDGLVPTGITTDLRSEGASLSVTDAPSVGATEKALTLDTNVGGEDRVFFTPTTVDGANKLVFETKYFLDITADSNQVFEYMSGSSLAGYVLITMSSEGKLTVSDYLKYNGVVNTGYFSTITIDLGTPQWIDLKLVSYEDTDGAFCTEIWINGAQVQISKNSHWTETTVDSITSLRYRTFTALDAKVYFDDLKIEKIKE